MRPHPRFRDYDIPSTHSFGDFTLKALCVGDLVRDFVAVMESAADIKAANPTKTWPDGLTLEDNLLDLAWHQKEFEKRRSYAWVIEDRDGTYIGCLYLYPSIKGEAAADVEWWWRTGISADDQSFRAHLSDWVSSAAFPDLDYRSQSR